MEGDELRTDLHTALFSYLARWYADVGYPKYCSYRVPEAVTVKMGVIPNFASH
jgi:hypothetical protein